MLAKAFVDNAKVMAKGQVTIPKDVRDVLGVASGDRVTFVVEGNTVRLVNSAVYAMQMLQQEMDDFDSALYQTGITYDQARAALTDTWDIDVINCYRFGIVDGVGNNKFGPNESLTREQAAKILMGAANKINLPGGESSNVWADASQISSWAHEGINYVVGAGIMNGTGNNQFDPQGMFTREQAIITVYRMVA